MQDQREPRGRLSLRDRVAGNMANVTEATDGSRHRTRRLINSSRDAVSADLICAAPPGSLSLLLSLSPQADFPIIIWHTGG